MAQPTEQNHSFDPSTLLVKRKRGRPRKEDVPGSDPGGSTQRRRRNPIPTAGQGLVGQPVAGILDGVFDAGFLISVRAGNGGPLLRGMVFDSRLSVPISTANDVAPHIKMSKRDEIPIPISVLPLQRRDPVVTPPIAKKLVLNDGSQESALRSKGSEAVISGVHLAVSKEAVPVTTQISDTQREGLAGELKPDSTSQTSPQPHVPPPAFEPDFKDLSNDSYQHKSSSPTAATQVLTSQASSEVLQETKTVPDGNGSSQAPSSAVA